MDKDKLVERGEAYACGEMTYRLFDKNWRAFKRKIAAALRSHAQPK